MLTKIVRNMNLKMNSLGEELNSNEKETLRFISKHENCISSDIVVYLNVDKALVTRMVNKLIDRGYVVFHYGEDRRKKYLVITPKGLELKLNDQQFEIEYYQKLFSPLDEEEKAQFLYVLEKIYRKSKEMRKNPNEKIR